MEVKATLYYGDISAHFTYKFCISSYRGHEDLFCDIINTSMHQYENKDYLTPAEKHLLVKVMGFCLYLIDSEQVNVVKLDAKRRLRLDRMDKIFHELEVGQILHLETYSSLPSITHPMCCRWCHCSAICRLLPSSTSRRRCTSMPASGRSRRRQTPCRPR